MAGRVTAYATMPPAVVPGTSRILSRESLRVAALVLVTVLIWCAVEHRWSARDWQIPVEYHNDPGAVDIFTVLASIKAASDGDYIPFKEKLNPRLGAPYGASWNDYPNNEQIQVFLTGMLADSIGLFPAANFAMLLLFVLSACSFYFVCRQFRCSWQWAFAMALVFAFSQFVFAHGQHHLTVAACWNIPLCLLVCRWVSTGGGLQWRGWRFRFAVAVALVAGIQNIYYAAIFIQLLGLGCALQLMRRNWRALVPAVAVGGVAFVTFLVMNVNMFIYHFQHGPNPGAITRRYKELEWTGMKFVDFFMPWQHRWPAFANWAQNYFDTDYIHGEAPPASYLGIVGIVALVWFALRIFRRIAARPPRPLPLGALQLAWIFLFATVGGLNGLAGSAGFILLRATTRYSIVVLCILLLFLARRLSTLAAKSPVLSRVLPLAMVALALWDQTPKWKSADDIAITALKVVSDRRFTEAMERDLPENAMVFQLPIMDYPENANKHVLSYEHFRPYLFSRTLRFSFGGEKGRPFADWQHDLDGLAPAQLVAKLEQYGFSAIYINRRGVTPEWELELVEKLRSQGKTGMVLSPDAGLLCVFLKPVVPPASPLPTAVPAQPGAR